MIVATNLLVATVARPLGRLRWLLFLFVATAPFACPSQADLPHPILGALTLVVTTLSIVTAARLPELDHVLNTKRRTHFELFVWMSLPMARFALSPKQQGQARWRRVLRYVLRAGAKQLAWLPFAYLLSSVSGIDVHWILRSSVLMLYFVLNMTAMADLGMALSLVLGSDAEELFDTPLLSYSPRDFWGRRWNKYINRFALKHVALKLGRKRSPLLIMLAVFFTSGLFHEYFAYGVGGSDTKLGWMFLFFAVQGLVVWLGTRLAPPKLPHAVGTALTFLWMAITAPLFFLPVEPALRAFAYPPSWYPFLSL